MRRLTNSQRSLLRQLSEGRLPDAQVRYATTSWWFGDVSVTRDMNTLRKMGLIRCWRDGARNQHMAVTDEGAQVARGGAA